MHTYFVKKIFRASQIQSFSSVTELCLGGASGENFYPSSPIN